MTDSKLWWQPIDEILPVHKQERRRAGAELHKRIAALEADNKRLRRALEYIAEEHTSGDRPVRYSQEMWNTAREALAEGEGSP